MTVDADTSVLVVPTRVDVVVLPHAVSAIGPTADYRRLPRVDPRTGVDVNPNTPFLADAAFSAPFNTESALEAGAHVHWILPDCLRRAKHPIQSDGEEDLTRLVFPRVCNRWVVRRSVVPRTEASGTTSDPAEVKHWVVQSDYLWPEHELPRSAITVLMPDVLWPGDQPAIRAMGFVREIEIDATDPTIEQLVAAAGRQERPGDSWEEITRHPLTIMGPPDDVSFASLYPSCRNVFGLHDDLSDIGDMATVALRLEAADLRYEVLGYYVGRDLVDELTATAGRIGRGSSASDTLDFMTKRLRLDDLSPGSDEAGPSQEDAAAASSETTVPQRLLVTGATEVTAPPAPRSGSERVHVAMGHRPADALIAMLADEIDEAAGVAVGQAERSLASLRVGRHIEGNRIDLGPRLDHALHQGGFKPVDGGTRWRIVRRPAEGRGDATVATTGDSRRHEQLTLPLETAHLLERLNRAQVANDQQRWQAEASAELLHADWARAMQSLYRPRDLPQGLPDFDAARDWIASRLDAVQRSAGGAAFRTLLQAKEAVEDAIEDHNTALAGSDAGAGTAWELRPTPATRFWQPTDPAVMLASLDGADDGCLSGQSRYRSDPGEAFLVTGAEPLDALIDDGRVMRLEAVDHHPLLLDWEVEALPVEVGADLRPETRRYDPNWFRTKYLLAETEQELDVVDHVGDVLSAGLRIQGRTQLTPAGHDVLWTQIVDWLGRWIEGRLSAWHDADAPSGADPSVERPPWLAGAIANALAASHSSGDRFDQDLYERFEDARADVPEGRLDDFLDWLAAEEAHLDVEHPTNVLLQAGKRLGAWDGKLLGQALSGFGRRSLGMIDGPPLVAADPLGFDDYLPFSARVRAVVGQVNEATKRHTRPRAVPDPWAEFLPMRSGELRPLAFRLIDTFGRTTDLHWDQLDVPSGLRVAQQGRMLMAPRLNQAARLDVRWISATPNADDDGYDVEANDHPATSPVCGYLVANHLDISVQVFAANGAPLGSVADGGRWRMPPGEDVGSVRPHEIEQPTLRQLAIWLTESSKTPGFIDAYLDTLEAALEAIDPEDYRQHESHAMLASRPVAVVRANIDLQTRGPLVVDQGWAAYRAAMAGEPRNTRGVEDIDFPVRIGEHRMLDDGVVGFFVEEPDGSFADGRMLAPQGLWADGGMRTAEVVEWHEGHPALSLWLTVGQPPEDMQPEQVRSAAAAVTVLMDPRAHLHATTGILPARALLIPPDQIRDGLANIALWFQAAPVLSGPDDLELDLSTEPGWSWTWVANGPDGIERRSPDGFLSEDKVGEAVYAAAEAAGLVIADPYRPGYGRWRPGKDQTVDAGALADIDKVLEDHIVPAPNGPTPATTTAREGWLLMQPAAEQHEDT